MSQSQTLRAVAESCQAKGLRGVFQVTDSKVREYRVFSRQTQIIQSKGFNGAG